MSSAFNPIAPRARLLSAGIAVFTTAGILWSVLALAGHYDDEFLQVAHEQSAAVTMHAQAPSQSPAGSQTAGASHG